MITKKDKYQKEIQILKEMNDTDCKYWFYFKDKKFLHNVDTFYYSVKLQEDFTEYTQDEDVKYFRKYFEELRQIVQSDGFDGRKRLYFKDYELDYVLYNFGRFYRICLERTDEFMIFIAPSVPKSVEGDSLTTEIIVQLRSSLLWQLGVTKAFEYSIDYVYAFLEYFGFHISLVQENRMDYAWHSNYLKNPEKYFTIENFHKMRVDRFKGSYFHSSKIGASDYEIDYISIGKRSDKVFVRIYLKTKEVIEQGYKAFFFYIWFFNQLISRYDLFVYEECYKLRNWDYRDRARLEFYYQYGADEHYKRLIRVLLDADKPDLDKIRELADKLTPKLNLIINVEYQIMRKHSKNYVLLNLKDNFPKGVLKRVYDLLDNRSLIVDYLTHSIFRLVEKVENDSNKSRAAYTPFWKALRNTKLVDVSIPSTNLTLVRDYSKRLNADRMKHRAFSSLISYNFYAKGDNSDSLFQDNIDFINSLNDNDIKQAQRYKNRKRSKLSKEVLEESELNVERDWFLVDYESGERVGL